MPTTNWAPPPPPIMYNTFTNNKNLFKKATGKFCKLDAAPNTHINTTSKFHHHPLPPWKNIPEFSSSWKFQSPYLPTQTLQTLNKRQSSVLKATSLRCFLCAVEISHSAGHGPTTTPCLKTQKPSWHHVPCDSGSYVLLRIAESNPFPLVQITCGFHFLRVLPSVD